MGERGITGKIKQGGMGKMGGGMGRSGRMGCWGNKEHGWMSTATLIVEGMGAERPEGG